MTTESGNDSPSILLMSRGWDFDEWREFYPEDLPEEWRLSYYANEFRGVMVPEKQWLACDDCEEWAEDVHDEFLFYLEVAGRDGVERLQETVLALGANFGGLIVDGVDGERFSQLVSLVQPAPVIGSLSTNADAGCEILWADTPAQVINNDRVCVFINKAASDIKLAELRKVAETLHCRGEDGRPSLIVFSGRTPVMRQMEDCRIMLNLMGIA